MPNPSEAEEHLRVIRSLMEKATIYRAISAPTALVGGLAAIVATAYVATHFRLSLDANPANPLFLASWLAALAITAIANTYLLFRDARRRGDTFLSSGMRAAFRALWPNYLVAAILTIIWSGTPHLLPPAWIILYALGLLATQHFAPRSIRLLGWAFLVSGIAVLIAMNWLLWRELPARTLGLGNLAMGATFGLLHLIYAACTWTRTTAASDSAGEG